MSVKSVALTRSALARLLGLPHGACIHRVHDDPATGILTLAIGAAGLPHDWQPPEDVRLKLMGVETDG